MAVSSDASAIISRWALTKVTRVFVERTSRPPNPLVDEAMKIAVKTLVIDYCVIENYRLP